MKAIRVQMFLNMVYPCCEGYFNKKILSPQLLKSDKFVIVNNFNGLVYLMEFRQSIKILFHSWRVNFLFCSELLPRYLYQLTSKSLYLKLGRQPFSCPEISPSHQQKDLISKTLLVNSVPEFEQGSEPVFSSIKAPRYRSPFSTKSCSVSKVVPLFRIDLL